MCVCHQGSRLLQLPIGLETLCTSPSIEKVGVKETRGVEGVSQCNELTSLLPSPAPISLLHPLSLPSSILQVPW